MPISARVACCSSRTQSGPVRQPRRRPRQGWPDVSPEPAELGAIHPGRTRQGSRKFRSRPTCWCAQSYFTGSDGVGRVVSSAGHHIIIWKIQTSPSVTLVKERTLPDIASGQDPGFFTSVSSNGTQAGTAVVWAVSRPTDTNPSQRPALCLRPRQRLPPFSRQTRGHGPPPETRTSCRLSPTVRVFVASYQAACDLRSDKPQPPRWRRRNRPSVQRRHPKSRCAGIKLQAAYSG